MLKKAYPNTIQRYWPLFRKGVEASLPPISEGEGTLTNVLNSLLRGDMELWVWEREGQPLAFCITSLIWDEPSHSHNFLIYSLASFKPNKSWPSIKKEEWIEAFQQLMVQARKRKAKKIVAYTQKGGILWLVKDVLGGNTSWNFLELEIEED